MQTILVVNSSILGDSSTSRALVASLTDHLIAGNPQANIIHRDVGGNPLPHIAAATLAGFAGGDALEPAAAEARALSDDLISELAGADTLVIGAPMYNFGIPTTLKAWFDHVLRAGVTFRYTQAGPVGLLTGKRAIIIETRGGFYSAGEANTLDAQEPHLRAMLGFIGITDVTFIHAEKLAVSPGDREAALDGARTAIDALAARTALAA